MQRLDIMFAVSGAFIFAALAWSLAMQRNGIQRQKGAMQTAIKTQQEAMARYARSMELTEESVAIARKMLEHQQRMIAILGQIEEHLRPDR